MDMERFWNKKTVVSFILALFIAAIHNNTIVSFSAAGNSAPLIFTAELFNNLFSLTITRVAVPLFFVLSGACFFRNYEKGMYLKKIKSRIKTLFVPYLFWNTFLMAVIILLSYTSFRKLLSFSAAIVPTGRMIAEGIIWFRFNNAFWFIYALIILVVITPLIDLCMRKKSTGYVSCVLALIIPAVFSKQFVAIFQGQFYSAIFFYFVGCLIGRYYFDFFSKKAGKKQIMVSVIVCVLFVILKVAEIYTFISVDELVMNIVLLAAAMAFWTACDCFADKIKMRSFMSNSFMLYALHPFIGTVISNLIVQLWGEKTVLAIPSYILAYVLTVGSSLALAELLKHCVPKLYRVVSGNRG